MTDLTESGVTATVTLSDEHYAEVIVRSSVNPDVAVQRGYRTLEGTDHERTVLEKMGFSRSVIRREETYPALLIPMYKADGTRGLHQIKPLVPRCIPNGDGKPRAVKYETPRGARAIVDVPAFTRERLADLSVPLWITEGMKKTDALVSQGRAALGLTGVFNWRSRLGTLGDWEDIPLKGRRVVLCFDADARHNRNVQLAMARLGAWLVSKGVTSVDYLTVPEEVNGTPVKGVDDFFAAGGSLETLREAVQSRPPGTGPKNADFTDAVLAETVADEALDGRMRWASGIGWLAWNGTVWDEVPEAVPTEAVRQWAVDRFRGALDAARNDAGDDAARLIEEWRKVLSKGRLKALVDLSRGIDGILTDASELDRDAHLLCVRNGYVDLRDGSLHDPDPDRMMTKCAGAAYEPHASHPMWDKALTAIPEDCRDWYQDRIGQAATGHMTPDDCLVICAGDGSNGKSTVVGAVQRALGAYAVMVSDRVLMANPDAHPTELMDLRGARYAVLEETPEARRLDTHRLKKTVGTETIRARRIRQDSVEFTATHSLFVNTNFKPVVTETDHGTWRRLSLLPFPYTFRQPGQPLNGPQDREGDSRVREAAHDPEFRSAVLAWIVAGAVRWYEAGRVMRPMPERVQRETAAWRAETDQIMGFAADCLTFTADGTTLAKDMLEAFNGWAEDHGHRPWNDKTFSGRFGAHDHIKKHRVEKKRVRTGGNRSHPVTAWVGVTLGEENQGDDPWNEPGQSGPNPDSDKSDKLGGVQGVQAGPVNLSSRPTRGVSDSACTPCTPQLRGVHGQNGHPKSELLSAQNGHRPVESAGKVDQSVRSVVEAPSLFTQSDVSPGPVGFDLETRGKDWKQSPDPGFVKLVGHGTSVDTSTGALSARLRAGQVFVGANVMGFDVPALERHTGLRVEEWQGRIRDVQLQARIADPPTSAETKPGPNFKPYSLDALGQRLLGRSKDPRGAQLAAEHCTIPRCRHGKSKTCNGWENIPADDPRYAEYCRDDVALTEEVHAAMDWTPYMQREMDVQLILARMTLNGFRVDEDLLARRIAEGEQRKADALRTLTDVWGLPAGAKSPLATNAGKEWLSGLWERFGVTNPPRTPKGALATSTEVLGTIAGHPRCPADLREIIRLMGVVTSERTVYGTVRDHMVNGRVHPDIWPSQASGRWSVTNPGLTVVGKHGRLADERAVFLPEPGEAVIAVDLGQVDARIVAAHAQDPAYLELFGPGEDVHKQVALAIFGDESFRNDAKAIGHGANYGMGMKRLIADGHDPDKVRAYFQAREEKFPGLIAWQNRVREQGAAGEILDNGFGRPLRVEPDWAYTQAPAQIGQGGTRDMMARGLLELARTAPETLPMLRAIVHDEVVLSVPEKDAEEIGRTVVRAFECEWAPPGASIPVHIPADLSGPGRNWADAYKH